MPKKDEKETERFYAGGFYMTRIDAHTFKIPQGMTDAFTQWNEKHLGLQKTLEGIATYVAEQRGALYREQNQFWNTITDALGLPRGTQATILNAEGELKITPYDTKTATLKIEIVDPAKTIG